MSFVARAANRLLDLGFPPGSERLWGRRLEGRVLCLLYHRVDEPGRYPFLERFGPPVIAPEELARELGLWRRLGARFCTFRDLREGWFPGPREVGILVCFDDGFRDNYTSGLEIAARLGIQVTIFQTSALVGAEELLWEHALYFRLRDGAAEDRLRARVVAAGEGEATRELVGRLRLEMPRPALTRLLAETLEDRAEERRLAAALYPAPEDLRRALALGHEIGSHGLSHQPRRLLSDEEFERELAASRSALADFAGEAPQAYSYPFGDHRSGDERICARHFAQAAIVAADLILSDSSPFELPRCTWPGPARNGLRRRRWLLTGRI